MKKYYGKMAAFSLLLCFTIFLSTVCGDSCLDASCTSKADISDVFADKRNVLVLIADDYGMQSGTYGNKVCKTPNLDSLAQRSLIMEHGFTSVSSCSPSRSAILTGLPQHENGMYGLHHTVHHFQSFDGIQSLSWLLNKTGSIKTGIIGKKHVGPDYVYPFDFAYTEENYDLTQVGRNITLMKELAHAFLDLYSKERFMLYIGFHDPHRCGLTLPEYGQFCEKFGDGSPGQGTIPDWHPVEYDPSEVEVPYFVPDTPAARSDIANMYKTISRLDQGVGLMMQALTEYGVLDNTLVIFTSDNGIPFPSGRTNLYDPGMVEPFLISSPLSTSTWGQKSNALVSTTDIVPTILDWFGLPFPNYTLPSRPNRITLHGKSLLPLLQEEPSWKEDWDEVYSSHNLHEITMYYPMRVLRTQQYKLIHNLNFRMPFAIDQDFFVSPTFQDLLNRTVKGEETHWYKKLDSYYYRDEWELFNLQSDPEELNNVAGDPNYASVLKTLQEKLRSWQHSTNDPWYCAPGGVFENMGKYPLSGVCLSMHNGL